MNSALPPKEQVRQSFDKAATTYDSAAKVQRWVCTRLVSALPTMLTPAVILDAGCGTGFAQEILSLRFPAAHRIALDFSPAMLAQVERLEFGIAGDVEHLPLKNEVVGLYWSSLTAQWCAPDIMAHEAYRVLWPSGVLALSSLGSGTFRELEEAFAQVDHYRHTLRFQPAQTLEETLARAKFRDIHVHTEPCVAHFRDLKSLLHAIKAIGANQIGPERRRGLMGKDAWQKLEAAYEALRTPQGLPLTYQAIFCYAFK
jgi:malonyl-CoA O-methyltransferase